MKKKFRLWLCRKWRWFHRRSMYVILDPADSSVTLSQALFDHMDVMNQEQAKVFVCRLTNRTADNDDFLYGFTLNPSITKPTQLCDIQYNSKHRCIGFETLCPNVNRILYDYALPTIKIKLSVEPETRHGVNYYAILRP